MLNEALASAATVAEQLKDTSRVAALAAQLAARPRHVALTVARWLKCGARRTKYTSRQ